MSDRPSSETGGSPPRPDEALAQLRDDATRVSSEVQARAGEAASALREEALSTAGEIAQQGRSLMDNAVERAEDALEQGKAMGAEHAQGLARAIRHAAEDLEGSSPEVARHVRSAAEAVQGIAGALRERGAGELLEEVTRFARRQPAAFFGAAALAGFALARFAKAGSGRPAQGGGLGHPAPATMAPGWTREEDGTLGRPATMAAASLGGAAAHHAQHSQAGAAMPRPQDQDRPAAFPPSATAHGAGAATPMPDERSRTPL
ncbi:MAG: hypothetical protein K2X11_22915 [Acetobacteraceae bacterium]|nr:hypothetical protein [Acetobacteraceae bacterium]